MTKEYSFTPSTEQATVINRPMEPLRVDAGAGTGKTATLAGRIVHLVERGEVEPEQVLGITFTNKAAGELADRIRTALGDAVGPGREVEVHTYHGFAARLLEQYGALVGVESDARIVTPTFARQLMEDALAGGSYRLLDLTNRAYTVNKLARLASQLGDNLLTPTMAIKAVPVETDDIWDERRELLETLERYWSEKTRMRVVDYADLIERAAKLVEEHPEIAKRVADRYRVVLLDEYQDTNPAQREMLRGLFAGGYSVTAVGDPDQTIYEWRGASLENFAGFPGHFPLPDGGEAATLPLTLNRRSGSAILDLANDVRDKIDERARKPLQPVPGTPPGEITVSWSTNAIDEAEKIATIMRSLHDDGIAWRDMAVLFRKNKDIAIVHDALEEHGIPVEVANLGGLLGIPEVADVHAWLRILGDPDESPSLMRILTGSRFRLGLGDIAPLARWVRAHRPTPSSEGEPEGPLPPAGLLEAVDHLEEIQGLRSGAIESIGQFRDLFRDLIRAAQGESLVELTRQILDKTGAWQEVEAMTDAHRLSARLNLYRFLDLAEEWSPLEGRPSLQAFLDHLTLMLENQTEELDTARLSGEDAVALLTVHRAKGLEWPAVFIPALYERNFPSTSGGFDDPYKFASLLPYQLLLDSSSLPPITPDMAERDRSNLLRIRHAAQEWRVAYVAVTRAKQRLHMSGAHWYGSPEPTKNSVKPSPLFLLGCSHAGEDGTELVGAPPERPPLLRYDKAVDGAPDPVFPNGWNDGLRAVIDDNRWAADRAAELGVTAAFDHDLEEFQQRLFRIPEPAVSDGPPGPSQMSVSSLVTYAECPLRYYWSAVDRLPRRPSAAARRGVDVHRRIELHNMGAVPLDDREIDNYDITPADLETGDRASDPYDSFRSSRFATARPLLVEAPFDLRLADGTIVRGRIDAVYGDDTAWEVVDFKSGRPRSDPARRVQLQAYAVAVRDEAVALKPPSSLAVTFAYLGDGLVEVTEQADDEWVAEARQRIDLINKGIAQEVFDPIPSEACAYCDFLTFCEAGRAFMAEAE